MPAPASSFTLSVTLGEDSFSASGSHTLVLKAFEDFKLLAGVGAEPDARPERPTRKDAKGERPAGRRKGAAAKLSGSTTLPAFLAPLKLKSGPTTGAAIVAWCSEYGGKDKVSSAVVRDLWKGTKYKLPSSLGNVTRDLNNAVAQGLLRKEGKGTELVFYADAYERDQIAKWAEE